jgi:hypothetical protein
MDRREDEEGISGGRFVQPAANKLLPPERFYRLQAEPGVDMPYHFGAISGDASNQITSVWFKYAGAEVTEIPQGAAFEIHAQIKMTKAYLAARDPRWDPSPDYKWALYAVCWAENRCMYKDGLSMNIVDIADQNINDPYPGFSPSVMGTANQTWAVYLIGNLAGTASILTPAQLKTAFGA